MRFHPAASVLPYWKTGMASCSAPSFCHFLLVLGCLLQTQAVQAAATSATSTYEYIIVGAGSAGSIVAGELARHGNNVLLVEAGGDNFDPAIRDLHMYLNLAYNFHHDFDSLHWGYETTNQTFDGASTTAKGRVISLPSGKVLGGTHSINAAAYVPGNAQDFDNIAQELQDSDWEWDRTAHLRHFLEETIGITNLGHQQEGAQAFTDNAQETLGLPINHNPTTGYQYGISAASFTGQATSQGGRRTSSFDAFVLPHFDGRIHSEDKQEQHRSRGSIEVVTYHHMESLIFDPHDETRVVGVRGINRRRNTPVEFFASHEVILSAGTYNSPQLLMRSGIGPAEHLSNLGIQVRMDLPGVGSNLRDHYCVGTFWEFDQLNDTAPFLFQSPIMSIFGPESEGLTSYQIAMSGNYGSCIPLRQESSGTVRLQSPSIEDAPLIDPNVLSTKNDFESLKSCLKDYLLPFFGGLVSKGLLKPGSIDPQATEEEIEDYILDRVGPDHHPVGTCKTGSQDDPMAVVDNSLVVRGMSNLRVIDASVLPKTPSANINASVMTMALIGVSKILDQCSSSSI